MVSALAADSGAKSIPLKVSGAWHSQLIKGAESDFIAYMEAIKFQRPTKTVVHNVTAEAATDPAQIKEIMGLQLCSPVRWYESICKLVDEKVSVFAEIGPGKVLTGLVRKIVPRDYPCQTYNVNNMKTFEKFLKSIS
jgi:[acyl-carrier-protein] S-malonyltransferase